MESIATHESLQIPAVIKRAIELTFDTNYFTVPYDMEFFSNSTSIRSIAPAKIAAQS